MLGHVEILIVGAVPVQELAHESVGGVDVQLAWSESRVEDGCDSGVIHFIRRKIVRNLEKWIIL